MVKYIARFTSVTARDAFAQKLDILPEKNRPKECRFSLYLPDASLGFDSEEDFSEELLLSLDPTIKLYADVQFQIMREEVKTRFRARAEASGPPPLSILALSDEDAEALGSGQQDPQE